MAKQLDGQRVGLLTVISISPDEGVKRRWVCRCDCGTTKTVQENHLVAGAIKSCGCLRHRRPANWSHGRHGSPEWRTWINMRDRCYRKGNKAFRYYGKRGIRVCERWKQFANFFADMGEKPSPKHTLERIDVNGDYCPENCIWTDWKSQERNRTNNRLIEYNGETRCLSEWAELLGFEVHTLLSRLDRGGWSIHESFTTPIGAVNRGHFKKGHPYGKHA